MFWSGSLAELTRRVFFALWPDEAARQRLAALADAMHGACAGRVMQPRNLHMTLVFVGNATDGDIRCMTAAARDVHMPPFQVRIDRCQYWRHNRILWAGGDAPSELLRLSQDLRAALDGAGIHFDHKAFVPHMTLLRNARAPQSLPVIEPIEWTAREFVLLASRRDAEGPVYRSLGQAFG